MITILILILILSLFIFQDFIDPYLIQFLSDEQVSIISDNPDMTRYFMWQELPIQIMGKSVKKKQNCIISISTMAIH